MIADSLAFFLSSALAKRTLTLRTLLGSSGLIERRKWMQQMLLTGEQNP